MGRVASQGDAGGEVSNELLPEGKTVQSRRANPIRPRNAKWSDVRKMLAVAARHAEELNRLWEETQGTASE